MPKILEKTSHVFCKALESQLNKVPQRETERMDQSIYSGLVRSTDINVYQFVCIFTVGEEIHTAYAVYSIPGEIGNNHCVTFIL